MKNSKKSNQVVYSEHVRPAQPKVPTVDLFAPEFEQEKWPKFQLPKSNKRYNELPYG